MCNEMTVNLEFKEKGRVVSGGAFIDENKEKVNALFAFDFRAAQGKEDPSKVDIYFFKESDSADEEEWNQLLDAMHKHWGKGDSLDFKNLFKGEFSHIVWDIFSEEFPVEAEIRDMKRVETMKNDLIDQRESKEKAESFLSRVEKLKADFETDFSLIRDVMNSLKTLQKELGAAGLIPKHKRSLRKIIDELYAGIEEKRSVEQEKNLKILSPMVDEAIRLSKECENFKEAWEYLVKLQDEFKGKMLEKDAHDALWLMVQESFQRLKGRQKEYFESLSVEKDKNYNEIKPLVIEAREIANNEERFKTAWMKLKDIQNKFNSIRLDKNHRDELRTVLQESFEKLKEREKAYFEEKEGEWTKNYEELKEKLFGAVEKVRTEELLKNAWDELKGVQTLFKGARMKREHQEELWSVLQNAFEELKVRQDEERVNYDRKARDNFKILQEKTEKALHEAYFNKNFNETFNDLRNLQKEIFTTRPVKRERREQLIEKINRAFEVLKKRQDSYFKEKKQVWREKQENFLSKITFKKEQLTAELEELDPQSDEASSIRKRLDEIEGTIREVEESLNPSEN